MRKKSLLAIPFVVGCAALSAPLSAMAQDDDEGGFVHQQREMMQESNPAEHWVWRGQDLFEAERGPNEVSLADTCDFGLGEGVIEGAHAQMPRYFEDTGKVMDIETRIIHCMKEHQGFTDDDEAVSEKHTGSVEGSDLVAIATYVGAQSQGMEWDIPRQYPIERAYIEGGEEMFYYRTGPYDMSCQTCHADDGKRVRAQAMYNVDDPEQTAIAISWPAYRIGHGTVRTDQHRARGCYYQMRWPGLEWGSPGSIALWSFLRDQARGGPVLTPHLKR